MKGRFHIKHGLHYLASLRALLPLGSSILQPWTRYLPVSRQGNRLSYLS
jgi:hypothetical protein